METSLIGTGFPYRDGQNVDQYLAQFRLVTEATAGVRRAGAATLDQRLAESQAAGYVGALPWSMRASDDASLWNEQQQLAVAKFTQRRETAEG